MPQVFYTIGIVLIQKEWNGALGLALFLGMVTAIIVTAAIFYGYTSIVKTCYLPIDIGIFVVACIVSCYVYSHVLAMEELSMLWQMGGTLGAVILVGCFALWSNRPPDLPYFTRVAYKCNS